jgi:hypothetical protein
MNLGWFPIAYTGGSSWGDVDRHEVPAMRESKTASLMLALLLGSSLAASGCAMMRGRDPIPPAGTTVSSTSAVFRQTAKDLVKDCERIGGCTCILDGMRTTCAVVFACLDAGFCKLVSKP